jgi:hypothetical protein
MYDDYDYADKRMARRARQLQDAEYERGQREAREYLENRKWFGDEMAEALELEREMRMMGEDW